MFYHFLTMNKVVYNSNFVF